MSHLLLICFQVIQISILGSICIFHIGACTLSYRGSIFDIRASFNSPLVKVDLQYFISRLTLFDIVAQSFISELAWILFQIDDDLFLFAWSLTFFAWPFTSMTILFNNLPLCHWLQYSYSHTPSVIMHTHAHPNHHAPFLSLPLWHQWQRESSLMISLSLFSCSSFIAFSHLTIFISWIPCYLLPLSMCLRPRFFCHQLFIYLPFLL